MQQSFESEFILAVFCNNMREKLRCKFSFLKQFSFTPFARKQHFNSCLLFSDSFFVTLLSGRYEYSQSFRDSQSSDGSVQGPSEFGTNMVYYYDDGNKVQMYTVDEKLLKEYIKRQMWVWIRSAAVPRFLYYCFPSPPPHKMPRA